MSTARFGVVVVVFLTTVIAVACNGDGSLQADVADAGAEEASASPYGLDRRPSNTTCVAPPRPPPAGPVTFQRVYDAVPGLTNNVIMMVQRPADPSRWFAAIRQGTVVSFSSSGTGAASLVADLGSLAGVAVNADGEGGLLAFVFHPKFALNGQAYVSWTSQSGDSNIGRLVSVDGGQSFTQYASLVTFPRGSQHCGGGLAFGKDGFLYASFGDAGGSFRGQDASLPYYAKIIRIDVDTPPPPGETFVVPGDNPFKNGGGHPATFAYGFRNPFRFSFDRESGDLWIADVGDNRWEEIDVVRAGGNYGWPCREGAHDHTPSAVNPAQCPSMLGLAEPVAEIEHVPAGARRAITGGVVYRGLAIPSLVGTYVFGDSSTTELSSLSFDPVSSAPIIRTLNASGGVSGGWVHFAEDVDGEVYAVGLDGPIYKLVPAAPATASAFPDRLSRTGCVEPGNPKRPAAGLVPYRVNAELWSDGARKERWIALPDGKSITIGEGGDFLLPVGAVAMKTFSLGPTLVETRLLVRHDDGEWAGYSFEWDDAQTDALLLPSNKVKRVAGQDWYFPSRIDCLGCHTASAGRTLGLELSQLNGTYLYESTGRTANQLTTLEHVGLLGILGAGAASLPVLPQPFGGGDVEARARAYLHANCAHCHRPLNSLRADIDLRFSTPLSDTRTCNAASRVGDLGIADSAILSPGSPARSVLAARLRTLGVNRMPPVASRVVDAAGTALVEQWITSLPSCP